MGKKKCLICKSSKLPWGTTFHTFPAYEARKREWCTVLGIDYELISKHSVLCSLHFDQKDVKHFGNHTYISHTAVPISFQQPRLQFDQEVEEKIISSNLSTHTSPEKSSTETLTASPSNILSGSDVEYVNAISQPPISPIKDVSKRLLQEHNMEITQSPSKSSNATLTASSFETLSASEVEQENNSLIPNTGGATLENVPVDIRHPPYKTKRTFQSSDNFGNVLKTPDQDEPPKKKNKILVPRFFGDIKYDDLDDPENRQHCWKIIQNTIQGDRKKIKNLQVKTRRLKNRIYSLQSLTKHLQQKGFISETAELTLNSTMSTAAQAIFKQILKKTKKSKHCLEIRQFALTLYFYSRKAYEYVREKFNNILPHTRTMSKWIATVDASPGFMAEAKNALKIKAKEAEMKGYKIICNLVLDEMAIYKKIEWDGKRTYGYIDLGTSLDGDDLDQAKQALVFMLVCLNGHWKIPVAYFIINSLTGREKANLVQNFLEYVFDTNIIISSHDHF